MAGGKEGKKISEDQRQDAEERLTDRRQDVNEGKENEEES